MTYDPRRERLISRTWFRWSLWLRNRRDPLAPVIKELRPAADKARKAHRKSNHHYAAIRDMRTASLKQALGRG